MKGKLNDRDAACPFFRAHTAKAIYCEGVLPTSGSETINFDRPNDKRIQYSVFCCYRYQNCERYAAIMKGYQDE